MSLGTAWHELTLQEMICLTSGKPLTELAREYEKKPDRVQLLIIDQSATGVLPESLTPPRPSAQDDLESYVILKWCPWFSRTFGVLSDAHLNMLTIRLLRLNTDETPVLLELLTAVSLVLKQPNVPYPPTCRHTYRAERFLFRS
ncbi:hypothetical protein DPEC_G00068070 [Dallia pectoralis]|uniref:Uncharacterized protein n=2 Tax=Dallia pectoralis TaxID=75939 RepID=A0ACC2H210_DALPE|nr:hypothetical protein DPEC_G00067870 [Dallia pectoralis]KAJ8009810.1 hypothetical protein DPEC_G00068070 [Dallia pectoralis]